MAAYAGVPFNHLIHGTPLHTSTVDQVHLRDNIDGELIFLVENF